MHLHIALKGSKRRDQYIQPKIKLFPSNQQRILNISGYDICVFGCDLRKPKTITRVRFQ